MRSRALRGLDAIEAVGVLDGEVAAGWRTRLETAGRIVDTPARAEGRDGAETYLSDLLRELRPGDDERERGRFVRFEGAARLLAAAGLIDSDDWEDRLNRQMGWPPQEEQRAREVELNAGGTQAELLAVLPGPDEVRGGFRLLLVLRFDDALTFLLEGESDPTTDARGLLGWSVRDDRGTRYSQAGSGGSDTEQRITFRTAPPSDAEWIELSHRENADAAFRVGL
jgi:hypothetical protein